MSVRNSIFIGEVFEIEVSAGLVHPFGVDLCQARVLTGAQFFGFCNRLEFKTITPMGVQNSSFVSYR